MSHIRSILFFLLVGTVCILTTANAQIKQDEHEEFWKIIQTMKDILAGTHAEQAQHSISPGAQLICGARLENLRDVVAGRNTPCTLADTSYHGVMIQAQTNASEDMGYVVLKTRKADTTRVRFHSVVLMKDSTGRYNIHAWHAGECCR